MFVNANSQVDREALRVHVLGRLVELKKTADVVCIDRRSFWERVETAANQSLTDEKGLVVSLVHQLVRLPQYIETWIDTAVDTSERFDFFVLSKAHELGSNDQQKDYYWALQIRHDQLVALVRVLEMLLDKLKLWTSLRPAQLFDDPVFAGLVECGVEDQVYLEAEKVYRERQQITGESRG